MAKAKNGDTVRIHYTGTLNDGTEFDSSSGRDPLEFTLGEGKVIPGFERAVIGMDEGESKKVTIASEDAYGPRREELVVAVSRDQLPPDLDPSVGDRLQLKQESGQTIVVRVVDKDDDAVTLDANHSLAGEDLTFDLELVEIV